ncbi:SET domain-containing protein 4 [Rhipicephalus sanguineus]|uniref:SET domain-containing protein 4 n=1 Tax=Rhipicephalus sanguineus TaxID=34632 RepID=UPI0018937BD7|nr:SET domain-containing protein 4 [Rhipicephalus sanguineus]
MPKKGRNHRKKARRRTELASRIEDVSADLLKWMTANGFKLHTQLYLKEFCETGRGLATQQMLSAGDTFLRVPTCLLITTETALSSSLRDFVIRNHRQLAPIEVLTLFLMNEKLRGHDSEWRFFINSLPTTYTTPVYLGSRLLAKLPCDMFRRAQTQVSRIRSTFLKLRTLLTKENGDGNSPLSSLSENFTWCLFVWAWTAVNTRCIFSEHKTGHSLWDDDKCALAPFLDCLNHHWKASVRTAVVGSYFEIVTNNNYQPNEQVFISYGSHDNRKLLLEYGFVLANNPNDVVVITREHLFKLHSWKAQAIPHFPLKLSFLEAKNVVSESCGFTVDGLTWNGRIVVQVLSHPKASRLEWNNLLFQTGEEELDEQQCQLVVTLVEAMLRDYGTPLPEGKDSCSQTVAAFIKEETSILAKQLQHYMR